MYVFRHKKGRLVTRCQSDNELGPFELTKNVVQTSVLMSNRAQASPDALRDPSLRNKGRLNTIEAVRQIVRRYGFRGLYTGFHLHALRDTVGSGLYFGVYETVKQIAAKELGPDTSPFGGPMIAGAICSTVPWFCVSAVHLSRCFVDPPCSLLATTDLSIRHPQDSRSERSSWQDQGGRRGIESRFQGKHVQRLVHYIIADGDKQHDSSESL